MKRLAQADIGTGSGTLLYTSPREFKCDVFDICIANTSSSSITLALHIVPENDSVGTTNMMFPDVNVPGNTLIQWTGVQSLNPLDFIQGVASASGITVTITGNEYR